MSQIIVTTGDIKQPYDILGPIYFQISNKGLFSNSLDKLKSQYSTEIQKMRSRGTLSEFKADWGFLYGEWSVGQSDFEAAFFIATEELKKRAKRVGADAIICMRQDIDMDTNGFAYFYLQMYGTAVKLRDQHTSFAEQYDHAEEMMRRGNYSEAEIIYFQLGDFRDSKDKAKAAYNALLTSRRNEEEKRQAEIEAQRQALELSTDSLLHKTGATKIDVFLLKASACTRNMEVLNLWKSFDWEDNELAAITRKITDAAQIERMYGSSTGSVQKLLDDIRKML